MGSGIYVIAGTVIADYTGPSVIVSFLVAGVCSFLAGLSYAELGARVPRSGSAYVYIYVTIGEFIAFVIGWDVILEYIIGTSSTASALSLYIDSLANNVISKTFNDTMHMDLPGIAPYPDWLAFAICIIITLLLIIGVKESSFLNMIFTGLNMLIILFIVIAGLTRANFGYWNLSVNNYTTWLDIDGKNVSCESTNRCGTGGFLPFGLAGVLGGAGKCFYAFIGFDAIATTGEEVKNAQRSIPLSVLFTLIVVATSYISVSAVLTLMIPYYILDPNTPMPQAFQYIGYNWATTIVSVGAIISLTTCMYSSMFPMPRVVYSMASDGLIFKIFSKVLPKFKTPFIACIFTGFFSGILVLMFDLNQLINLMSLGTLMAYALVSACCLVLRYRPSNEEGNKVFSTKKERNFASKIIGHSDDNLMERLFRPKKTCDEASAHLVNFLVIISAILIIILSIILNLELIKSLLIILVALLAFIIIALTIIIFLQPENKDIHTFKLPFSPFLQMVAVFVNVFLITTLSVDTFIRFAIWFGLGLIIYFGYGIRNSGEHKEKEGQLSCMPFIERRTKAMKRSQQARRLEVSEGSTPSTDMESVNNG